MEKKFVHKIAQQVALKNWYNIRNTACIYTVARRATTDEFVFNCINAGVRLATKAIIESGVLLRPKKGGKEKSGHSHSHKHGKHKHGSAKHGANDHLQFFLTEFDSNDANGGESVGTGTGSDGEVGFGSDSESDEGKNREQLSMCVCVCVFAAGFDYCFSVTSFTVIQNMCPPWI